MKISVNLATLSSPRERYAMAWALPLALAGAIGLMMLSYAGLRNYEEFAKIQTRVNGLVQRRQQLISRENELKKELDQPHEKTVIQKVRYVNGMIDQKRLSLTEVTERVAKLLPPTVRLGSMALTQPQQGMGGMEVRFVVVGKTEDALDAFLGRLDDASDFRDMAVATQGYRHGNSPGADVTISCTATYVGSQSN